MFLRHGSQQLSSLWPVTFHLMADSIGHRTDAVMVIETPAGNLLT